MQCTLFDSCELTGGCVVVAMKVAYLPLVLYHFYQKCIKTKKVKSLNTYKIILNRQASILIYVLCGCTS